MAPFKVSLRVDRPLTDDGRPAPAVLDYAVEVHGVPACEIVSILMAAATRILVAPVAVVLSADDAGRIRADWAGRVGSLASGN